MCKTVMENQSLIILTQYMIHFIKEIIENNQKFQLSEWFSNRTQAQISWDGEVLKWFLPLFCGTVFITLI